ncbi:hypothetical protein MAR_006241, partial [Mya arenaria]
MQLVCAQYNSYLSSSSNWICLTDSPQWNYNEEIWPQGQSGYLVAGEYQHASASEFICLDKRPKLREGGSLNHDGKTFYLAEAVCGSLPCPPYVEGRELTCVVCS